MSASQAVTIDVLPRTQGNDYWTWATTGTSQVDYTVPRSCFQQASSYSLMGTKSIVWISILSPS